MIFLKLIFVKKTSFMEKTIFILIIEIVVVIVAVKSIFLCQCVCCWWEKYLFNANNIHNHFLYANTLISWKKWFLCQPSSLLSLRKLLLDTNNIYCCEKLLFMQIHLLASKVSFCIPLFLMSLVKKLFSMPTGFNVVVKC